MLYVDLDAHWKQSTFCVLDGQGRKVLSRTVQGRSLEVLEEVGKVGRPFAICFEASTGYGYLYDGALPAAGDADDAAKQRSVEGRVISSHLRRAWPPGKEPRGGAGDSGREIGNLGWTG